MPEDSISSLMRLKWRRISFSMANVRMAGRAAPRHLTVTQSIVKGVYTTFDSSENGWVPLIFHVKGANHKSEIRRGATVHVDVFFCGNKYDRADRFAQALPEYFSKEENNLNFILKSVGAPVERDYATLLAEAGPPRTEGETALQFHTPVPVRPTEGKSYTYISKEDFIGLFTRRFENIFGGEFDYHVDGDGFFILPYYWHYAEIRKPSKSQPDSDKLINGCAGLVYIKGSYETLAPLLLLGSELGAGSATQYGQGRYTLHRDSAPFYARFFPSAEELLKAAEEVRADYDSVDRFLDDMDEPWKDEETFARAATASMRKGAFRFSPYTAFWIGKPGGHRMVERPRFADLAAQKYLLRTIKDEMDLILEDESTGFRKGRSRQLAAAMVQQAIGEGFHYVIESDIEDFFPSVDHRILEDILTRYFPEKDSAILNLIVAAFKTGYTLNGELVERTTGLPQGCPLSPLLANLYLDGFDERIKAMDARLVRYADDFVILTRSKETAEQILSGARESLAGLGLKLNQDKTFVRPVRDGFCFLGMRFSLSGAIEQGEDTYRKMKKPLYITQPGLFLSSNGQALDMVKDKKTVETIPLRRISEILVMERAVISTAALAKCVEMGIPISITLGSGYYITTIKPDSRAYYDVSLAHGRKFESLPASARLMFAKEFAAGKLINYSHMLEETAKNRDGSQLRPAISGLRRAAEEVHGAGTVEETRGIEGAAARLYFQTLNHLIDGPAFHITKRERKKPDRTNSLLNFGYYLLFSRINASARAMGLNPYLGFLHSQDNKYESLVCDIEELFRASIDRFIVNLINLRVIGPDDFEERDSGMRMTREAVHKYLDQFEREMERKRGKTEFSLKDRIYMQVLAFKHWAVNDSTLTFYKWGQ